MKKSLFILSLLSIITLGICAQEPQKQTNDSIIFAALTHDYGTIVQGSNGSFDFKFTNKGNEPLILSNVQASCGCTVPEWPKEPIAGGKSGIIKVTYDTNRIGSFNKSITVTSNAKNAQVILVINGNITAKQ